MKKLFIIFVCLCFSTNSFSENLKKAYFAGGCFWGVEYYFSKAEGVVKAVSGFTGGRGKNPTYDDVCYKDTGHVEAVEVTYDSDLTNFEILAKLFFSIHDHFF